MITAHKVGCNQGRLAALVIPVEVPAVTAIAWAGFKLVIDSVIRCQVRPRADVCILPVRVAITRTFGKPVSGVSVRALPDCDITAASYADTLGGIAREL